MDISTLHFIQFFQVFSAVARGILGVTKTFSWTADSKVMWGLHKMKD